MRVASVALVAVTVLLLGGCSSRPQATTTPLQSSASAESTDALLAVASTVSSSGPVRIVGYELVMWEKGRLDYEVFVMKDGAILSPKGMWGAGPDFPLLEQRPPARLTPEGASERDSREAAIGVALANSAAKGHGADEGMVRIYLLEDASGQRFLMSPDGKAIAPAPTLEPWGGG